MRSSRSTGEATGLLVFISAWGGHEFRWKEVTIMAAVLAAFSVASFVYGLGLPMNVWPSIWSKGDGSTLSQSRIGFAVALTFQNISTA